MIAWLLLGKIERYGDDAAENRCRDRCTMQPSEQRKITAPPREHAAMEDG
jgi:hypothetical protein